MHQGLYSGKRWTDDTVEDIHIGLCCNPVGEVECFGITWGGDGGVGVLKGGWDSGGKKARLEVRHGGDNGWEEWGTVAVGEETVKGERVVGVADLGGQVFGGCWVGEAVSGVPGIPTNPITWYLTILTNGTALGCGYFSDSADVADMPTLFYTLTGTYNPATHQLDLTKRYEETTTTVTYTGTLTPATQTLHGTWNNTTYGTAGAFTARLQTETSDSLVCCETCNSLIPPGRVRKSCIYCPAHRCTYCDKKCCVPPAKPIATVPSWPEDHLNCGTCHSDLPIDRFRLVCVKCGTHSCEKCDFDGVKCCPDAVTVSFDALCGASDGCDSCGKPLDANGKRSMCLHCGACMCEGAQCRSKDYRCCGNMGMSTVLRSGVPVAPVTGAASCAELVLRAFKRFKNRKLFGTADGHWASYKDVYHKAAAFQSTLEAAGVKSVAFWCTPSVEYFTNLLGAVLAGATVIPLPKSVSSDTAAAEYSPDMVVTDEAVEVVKTSGVVGSKPVCILFTSGSTGTPKGIPFSEDLSLPTEGTTTVYPFIRYDFQEYDPTLLLSLLSTVQCGGSRYIEVGCEAGRMVRVMEKVKPTHFGAAPSVWGAIMKYDDASGKDTDFGGRLHVATTGGAATDRTILKWLRITKNINVTDLYGCREAGGVAKNGIVYPGVTCRVNDVPDMGYFARDGVGELLVWSPRMVGGYCDSAVDGGKFVEIDGKRYYKTGDVAELWTDGTTQHVNIIDRVGSIAKTPDGVFVSPTAIESAFESSPDVISCCFWTTPIPQCVCQVTHLVDPATLRAHALSQLTSVNVFPAIIKQTTDPLPSTETGKKKRNEIIAKYAVDEGDTPTPLPTGEVDPTVASILLKHLPQGAELSKTAVLTHVGCTSLAAHQICGEISREYGVTIQPFKLLEATVGWVEAAVSTGRPSGDAEETVEFWREVNRAVAEYRRMHCEGGDSDGKGRAWVVLGSGGFLGPGIFREVEKAAQDQGVAKIFKFARSGDGLSFDLTKEHLGIEPDVLTELKEYRIDNLIINAAWVSLTLPYSTLRKSNVLGPVHAVALFRPRSVTFVSSVAAWAPATQTEPIPPSFHEISGYGQSKSIAEAALTKISRESGEPFTLSIFRPGTIFMDRCSKKVNCNDFLAYLVKSCVEAKLVPTADAPSIKLGFDLTPADYVATAVAKSLLKPVGNVVYHLPPTRIPLQKLFSCIKDASPTTIADWKTRLQASLEPHPLKGTLLQMKLTSEPPAREEPDYAATEELMKNELPPAITNTDIGEAVERILLGIKG